MKVVLHPGGVTSKNDGDRHFINSHKLRELYGVRADDDVVVSDGRVSPNIIERMYGDRLHLYPLYDGKYYDIHAVTPDIQSTVKL